MKKKLVKLFCETAVLYTIWVFGLNLIYAIKFGSDANFASTRMAMALPGALILSFATFVRESEKIAALLKWIFHCLLMVAGVYLFFILPGLEDTEGNQKIVGLAITAVVYIVVILVIALVVNKVKRAGEESKKYNKKF